MPKSRLDAADDAPPLAGVADLQIKEDCMSAVISEESLPRLLTRADLAEMLQVSLRTIDRAVVEGYAGRPPLKPVIQSRATGDRGGIVRFDPAHVREWLAASPEPKEPSKRRGRPKKYRPGNSK